ncbi:MULTISPECIES: hypothetical protein [unclassified Halobacteriovorax]|uniref:hypothetical protein n=1 Tax=unclassified Halobacteriovorax TaxID=2639665 RepID=UPI00399BD98A
MKLALVILVSAFNFYAVAGLQTLRIVDLATVSSTSCYTAEQEESGSISSVSFYLGNYSGEGEDRTFNYYETSETYYASSVVCKSIKLFNKAFDSSLPQEEKVFKLFVDMNDHIKGFMLRNSDKVLFFEE